MDGYALGVSEYTTWPWTFEQDVAAYRRHGFSAIEITEMKLDHARLDEQFEMLRGADLTIASVQAKIHGIFPTKLQPEPADPHARLELIKKSIESLAPYLPSGTPFVAITGAVPDGNLERMHDTVVDALFKLSRFAAQRKMRIALEPLNPSLMNVDSALWSLYDAFEIVEEVGEANCGLCIDTWNVWRDPDLRGVVRRAADRIFLVQLSDYRRPRAFYDRLVPGRGEIPLGEIVRAVHDAGYRRPYVVEIFSSESLPDSLWTRNLDEVLAESAAEFQDIWAHAVAR
jgi:sugar phosphate isomerase/epimerase